MKSRNWSSAPAGRRREAEGKRFTLIVVAEGAHLPDRGLVHVEANGVRHQVRLGGIGEHVADELSRRLHRDVRTVVLGHLQRGGEPTPFDWVRATPFGVHAVRLIHQGQFGQMVCYRPPHIESVPIADAIRQLSRVDPDSSAVQAALQIASACLTAALVVVQCTDVHLQEASK